MTSRSSVISAALILTLLFTGLAGWLQGDYPDLLFHKWGNETRPRFGRAVRGFGDQNQDGYDDFIVFSGPGSDPEYFRTELYFGGNPLDTVPDYTWEQISSGPLLGDLNSDGIPDYCLSSGIYFGGIPFHEEPDIKVPIWHGDNNPMLYIGVGDVNGDGYDDAVGTLYANLKAGRVDLHYGGPDMDTIPEMTWFGENDNMHLRYWNFRPVDFNYDGYFDLILDRNSPTRNFSIHFGGPTLGMEPDTVFARGYNPDSSYSYGFTYYDDFNGDSYPEIIRVGVDEEGNATDDLYIIRGGAIYDPLDVLSFLPASWGSSSQLRVPAGDVNGDGYRDLLVGDDWSFVPFGEVRLYLGGPKMGPNPDFRWVGGYEGAPYPAMGTGSSMDWCGDVNGDGIDDIMFAAWNNLENEEGHVYIYSGDTSWVNPSVSTREVAQLTTGFALYPVHPNPFNPSTTIPFELPVGVHINLTIYDVLGRPVVRLIDDYRDRGCHQVVWNGRDQAGRNVPSGIYIARLVTPEYSRSIKMVLLR